MGKQDISLAVEQKITTGLIDIFSSIVFPGTPRAQQLQIQLQCRRRENAEPGEAFQGKGPIRLPCGIGENRERPAMLLLVTRQFFRLGKRNHRDHYITLLKLLLKSLQLAEVRLTGQSSEMTEENQKHAPAKHRYEINPAALQIEQRQCRDVYLVHRKTRGTDFKR